ncbi:MULTISPECIES: hypothetical protein [unclassified Pseudomonas]|uniref:hypothetical protein n=1 Tax=unclassified Pseudomonas TaxID=196821 RepID=UPI000BDD32CC|nr:MULTISPECIES: hypothetical protein [unclassified Pseudomonas]PVZ16230.1 hypothetical protein F474_01740 [Pseudomonas sp. URIL14HWK12:I12]PVZ25914.1 hypothetical protein F470_01370 [Pseudomonas sp. URIL14HWK12:I10]PVZ36562.1 hypothetical protein F472_01740 [Pseudomonas sp. URIL14HWK12:I11]SNZ13162.1 hypothetical protein SAMN05660463_02347 [Pseudomonas sp. URIL14HWK12:I9]
MTEMQALTVTLEKLYENQVAIAASIEELALWVEVRGNDEGTAENVRGALETLDRNADSISAAVQRLRGAPGQ